MMGHHFVVIMLHCPVALPFTGAPNGQLNSKLHVLPVAGRLDQLHKMHECVHTLFPAAKGMVQKDLL